MAQASDKKPESGEAKITLNGVNISGSELKSLDDILESVQDAGINVSSLGSDDRTYLDSIRGPSTSTEINFEDTD